MVTIKTEIRTSGNSLMKNKLCEVVIKPSQEGRIRIFSKGADIGFEACIDNLYSTDHCVTLCSKEHRTLLGDYKYKAMLCEQGDTRRRLARSGTSDNRPLLRARTQRQPALTTPISKEQ